jgi:hypothetical protein
MTLVLVISISLFSSEQEALTLALLQLCLD